MDGRKDSAWFTETAGEGRRKFVFYNFPDKGRKTTLEAHAAVLGV